LSPKAKAFADTTTNRKGFSLKKVFLGTVAALVVTSSALAATADGNNTAGASYFTHNVNIHYENPNLSVERFTWDADILIGSDSDKKLEKFLETTIYGGLTDNLSIAAGYAMGEVYAADGVKTDLEKKFYGGLAYKQQLGDSSNIYASYFRGSSLEDWRVGMTLTASDNSYIKLGYRHFKFTEDAKMKGPEMGYALKF
jgi:hypothetical protein